MGARGGGGSRGGGKGVSIKQTYGAAARNEMRGMSDKDFFHHALTHPEYQKYVKDENARRGNPVVFGSQGVEVGHMAHFSQQVWGKTVQDTGRITSISGDEVKIVTHDGHPRYFNKSSITAYAKDKNMGYGGFHMKVSNKKPIKINV